MHVLLLELPKLLRGILEHAIRSEAGCALLNEESPAPPSHAEPQVAPDVVILGITGSEDTTLLPGLFARWPLAQVVTVMPVAEGGAVYELRMDCKTMAGVSIDDILQVLRETPARKHVRAPT